MPRKSAAALLTPHVEAAAPRLQPSSDLSPEAAAIFRQLVTQAPRDHFRVTDAPVLEAYCVAVLQSRHAARELADGVMTAPAARTWLRIQTTADKTIASLSMRLRLCPQSRQSARTTMRQSPPGPRPWT
jgi:phage terminase small subunit